MKIPFHRIKYKSRRLRSRNIKANKKNITIILKMSQTCNKILKTGRSRNSYSRYQNIFMILTPLGHGFLKKEAIMNQLKRVVFNLVEVVEEYILQRFHKNELNRTEILKVSWTKQRRAWIKPIKQQSKMIKQNLIAHMKRNVKYPITSVNKILS